MTEGTPKSGADRPARSRVGLRVILFVSLALNLAVVGLLVGAYLNMSRGDDHPGRISRDLGLSPYLYVLDSEQRRELQKAAAARKGDLRSGRAEWKKAYAESLEVLRSEPFDVDRFRDLMNRQARLADDGRRIGQEVVVVQISEMTAEARAALADKLEKKSFAPGGPPANRDGARPQRPRPQ